MQNPVLGSFYSSFLGIEIDFLYSLASSLFWPQPRFHTKSNNVPAQFPCCITWCVFPDSPVNVLLCRDEPAPGFSQFTTSTDSQVSACRPGVKGEEGRVVLMGLGSPWLPTLCLPRFPWLVPMFFIHICWHPPSLSALSRLSPYTSWNKISVPQPGKPSCAH